MNRNRWLLAGTLITFAAATGCSSATDDADPQTPPPVKRAVALTAFDSCEQLETYVEDVAVRTMKEQVDDGGYYGWGLMEADGIGAPSANAAGADDQKSSEPAAHTTTNNQVAGVDEPDFVKNDGTRVFVLSGQYLHAANSWPPADLALPGRLEIEGWPQQMALDADKDRIVVFSSVSLATESKEPASSMRDMMPEPCYEGGYCGGGLAATKITIVDVSNLSKLAVVRELYLPGSYVSGRSVGSSVRVVLRDNPIWPEGVRFYPEVTMEWPTCSQSVGIDREGKETVQDPDCQEKWAAARKEHDKLIEVAKEKLKSANEKIIRAAKLEDWLPEGKGKAADGSEIKLGYDCSDFHHADVPVKLGLASVITLNLADEKALSRTSILGEVHQIYASQTSLYLANQHWWWRWAANQQDHTYLHKFDITDPDRAVYVASGGVEGHLLNQFSLDEHKGYLRVATTINRRLEDPKEPWRTELTNRVSVLAEKDGLLEVIGKTPDLAKDERIYSARFIGDKGFVVTFRQVDPLFTLDLSEPTSPEVVGELKVPGFSSYIHPLGDNHLLTLGVHVPEPDAQGVQRWDEQRVKLTIFDVSDFANPKEKFTELVGTAHGHSEAQYEHKAFNFFAEKGLLAIPFYDWSPERLTGDAYWNSFTSDLRLFRIDETKGITPAGAVSMKDVFAKRGEPDWRWYYSPWVRRSVMAADDDGKSFVYAITDAGIRVAEVATPGTPIKTVDFPYITDK